MPRDELADPATDAAEEPAAVNVHQRVRCRPLYSRPVRHDLMKEWVGMSQRPFWRWLLLDKEWAWMQPAAPLAIPAPSLGTRGTWRTDSTRRRRTATA